MTDEAKKPNWFSRACKSIGARIKKGWSKTGSFLKARGNATGKVLSKAGSATGKGIKKESVETYGFLKKRFPKAGSIKIMFFFAILIIGIVYAASWVGSLVHTGFGDSRWILSYWWVLPILALIVIGIKKKDHVMARTNKKLVLTILSVTAMVFAFKLLWKESWDALWAHPEYFWIIAFMLTIAIWGLFSSINKLVPWALIALTFLVFRKAMNESNVVSPLAILDSSEKGAWEMVQEDRTPEGKKIEIYETKLVPGQISDGLYNSNGWFDFDVKEKRVEIDLPGIEPRIQERGEIESFPSNLPSGKITVRNLEDTTITARIILTAM